MLVTGIIFLCFALAFGGAGWVQINAHYDANAQSFSERLFYNPGCYWAAAAALVCLLSLILIIRALTTRKKQRENSRLPYFFSEISILLLGLGSIGFGFFRNRWVDLINADRLAAVEEGEETALLSYDGTLWIVIGAIAALVGLVFLCTQILKGISPAFAAKVEHSRIYGFFRDYKSEMKKIVWSSKEDVFKNTVVVVVTLVIVGALVGLLDLGFTKLLLLIGKIGA